jgi:hypothetical protein
VPSGGRAPRGRTQRELWPARSAMRVRDAFSPSPVCRAPSKLAPPSPQGLVTQPDANGHSRGTFHFPSWARVYSTTSRICAVVRTPVNEGMVSSGLARPFVTTAISSSMFGKSRIT